MSDESNVLPDEQGNPAAVEAETPAETPEVGANPDAEPKPSEQGEEPGDDDGEAKAKDGSKAPDDDQGKDDAKERKKSRYQERVQQLVEQRKDAERRAQLAEQRLAELQGKDDPRPSYNDEKYQDDPDAYAADLNAWTLRNMRREDVAETVKADRQQANQARIDAFQARVEAYRDEVPDFEEVAFHRAPINDANTAELIMESEYGPQIAYYLGKHPAEARELAGLSPMQKALAIGRLEGKLSAPPSAPKRVTQAPEPIVPAAGTRSPTKLAYSADMSMDDYKKWRKQQGIE